MAMVVQHNLSSMFTSGQLNITSNKKAKSTEKLSSGYRINRSADDAAGLAISEKMRWQIRGLNRASENIQDGISFCNVADGALSEVHSMLGRIRELSIQASNDTNTPEDRKMIDEEVQQIKDGIKDIFSDTMFNTKFIFRVPYVPDVSGKPTDMSLFTSSSSAFGGAEIEHVRYTWGEMGMSVNSDGTFAGNYTFETTTAAGEYLRLTAEEGQPVSRLSREYAWSADETGIYVNDTLAASWSSLGITSDADVTAGKEIAFTYHGMNVEFMLDESDQSISDVAKGINGEFSGGKNVRWAAAFSSVNSEQALDTVGSQTITITNANKNVIDETYLVKADDDGVWIEDSAGTSHRKMTWTELFATGGSGDGSRAGWGQEDGSNQETFSETEIYRYTDKSDSSTPGLTFTFQIQDQSSKAAAIGALNNMNIGRTISSPVKGVSSDSAYVFRDIKGFSDFDFQRSHGRDFDDPASVLAAGTITRNRVQVDGESITGYRDAGGGTFEEITYQKYYDTYTAELLIDKGDGSGEKETITYTGQSEAYYLGTDEDSYSSGYLKILDENGNISNFVSSQKSGMDVQMNAGDSRYASYSFVLTKPMGLNGEDSGSMDIRAAGYATRVFDMSHENMSGNTNMETEYRMNVLPPTKMLHIQSGALAWQDIPIEWTALNNSIIGISNSNTLTYAASQASIADMDFAIDYISTERSRFGAYTNRLEHAYKVDQNTAENTQAAESRIRDTDMASEMVNYSKHEILAQAGQAMLVQANQQPQGILSLLR